MIIKLYIYIYIHAGPGRRGGPPREPWRPLNPPPRLPHRFLPAAAGASTLSPFLSPSCSPLFTPVSPSQSPLFISLHMGKVLVGKVLVWELALVRGYAEVQRYVQLHVGGYLGGYGCRGARRFLHRDGGTEPQQPILESFSTKKHPGPSFSGGSSYDEGASWGAEGHLMKFLQVVSSVNVINSGSV